MKAAVVVLSDPKSGSEESLGRLFNALAATYDFKQRGDDVRLLFAGTGTRWASSSSQFWTDVEAAERPTCIVTMPARPIAR